MTLTLERQAFTVEPRPPVLGASIAGAGFARAAVGRSRAVYDAFIRHHVLCFRDQHLDQEQQVAFTEQFGTLERHIASNRGTVNPLVHIVTNLGADGKPSGKVASTAWHSDKSFRSQPSLATILHALVMPPDGGETCFANMIAVTRRCRGREGRARRVRVVHSWEISQARAGNKAPPEEIADAPPMSHPLVRTIPETGRKALFMGNAPSSSKASPRKWARPLERTDRARGAGTFRLPSQMGAGRCADVGQPLSAASREYQFRRGPLSAGAAADLSARDCACLRAALA